MVVRPSDRAEEYRIFSARKLAIESGRAAMLAALPAPKTRLAVLPPVPELANRFLPF
jgi:hypothetical protein